MGPTTHLTSRQAQALNAKDQCHALGPASLDGDLLTLKMGLDVGILQAIKLQDSAIVLIATKIPTNQFEVWRHFLG